MKPEGRAEHDRVTSERESAEQRTADLAAKIRAEIAALDATGKARVGATHIGRLARSFLDDRTHLVGYPVVEAPLQQGAAD